VGKLKGQRDSNTMDYEKDERYTPDLEDTWTTRSGEVFLVRLMDVQHIENCIRMLNRYKTIYYIDTTQDSELKLRGLEDNIVMFEKELRRRENSEKN